MSNWCVAHDLYMIAIWPHECCGNPRPRPSVLPKICLETSANMAARCWSGDQAVGLGRRPLPDGWFCGTNQSEDLTCTAVDCWRRRRRPHECVCWKWFVAQWGNCKKSQTETFRIIFLQVPKCKSAESAQGTVPWNMINRYLLAWPEIKLYLEDRHKLL